MPQWLINSLIRNVIYPLLLRGVNYIVENYFIEQTKKEKIEKKEKRTELIKQIKQAKTNDEIIKLSRDLHSLNVGKM